MPRRYLLVVAMLGAVVAMPVASVGADEPDDTPDMPLSVTPDEGPPGSEISVSGTRCGIGTRDVEASITDLGTPLASTTTVADGDGNWSLVLDVPASIPLGEYTIVADCASQGVYRTQRFVVTEEAQPEPGTLGIGENSPTNIALITLAVLGALLIVGGVALILRTRRTRS